MSPTAEYLGARAGFYRLLWGFSMPEPWQERDAERLAAAARYFDATESDYLDAIKVLAAGNLLRILERTRRP